MLTQRDIPRQAQTAVPRPHALAGVLAPIERYIALLHPVVYVVYLFLPTGVIAYRSVGDMTNFGKLSLYRIKHTGAGSTTRPSHVISQQ